METEKNEEVVVETIEEHTPEIVEMSAGLTSAGGLNT